MRGTSSPAAQGESILAVVALLTGGAAPIFALLIATTVGLSAPPLSAEQMAMMSREMLAAKLEHVMWPDQAAMMVQMPDKVAAMMGGMMAAHPVMQGYTLYVLVPSAVILAIVTLLSLARYPGLANRILVGVVAGVAGTVALDAIRLGGFALHWMPANLPSMFGMLILGDGATRGQIELVGYPYHFLNGIDFALVYTLLLGRARWQWGIGWGLVVWVLMMITPPMLMMGVGPFGVNFGPMLVVTTFLAHVAYGAVLGVIAQNWVRDERGLWHELPLSGLVSRAPSALFT